MNHHQPTAEQLAALIQFAADRPTGGDAMKDRIIVEFDPEANRFLVMYSDGRVDHFSTKRAVLQKIRARAKRAIRHGAPLHIAEIEWRGLPVESQRTPA